ncbi:hypothetical protein C5167_040805 [Papaver somniferum]|uniref:Uncharacterized protein n=1 Tax=Papaver somniferum TaxID=3469 RepID=A0A4Y7IG28_PAPSO|nr:hypothetical protein C5167_040805 [Papaver somniferum]
MWMFFMILSLGLVPKEDQSDFILNKTPITVKQDLFFKDGKRYCFIFCSYKDGDGVENPIGDEGFLEEESSEEAYTEPSEDAKLFVEIYLVTSIVKSAVYLTQLLFLRNRSTTERQVLRYAKWSFYHTRGSSLRGNKFPPQAYQTVQHVEWMPPRPSKKVQ